TSSPTAEPRTERIGTSSSPHLTQKPPPPACDTMHRLQILTTLTSASATRRGSSDGNVTAASRFPPPCSGAVSCAALSSPSLRSSATASSMQYRPSHGVIWPSRTTCILPRGIYLSTFFGAPVTTTAAGRTFH